MVDIAEMGDAGTRHVACAHSAYPHSAYLIPSAQRLADRAMGMFPQDEIEWGGDRIPSPQAGTSRGEAMFKEQRERSRMPRFFFISIAEMD